jgi:hypothetical protein
MKILELPAATSETIDVELLQWDVADPSALTWQAAVSSTSKTQENGAPGTFTAATIINRGTAASPDWRIRVTVTSLAAGTYGVWVKVAGSAGSSPVRYSGQLILY